MSLVHRRVKVGTKRQFFVDAPRAALDGMESEENDTIWVGELNYLHA
jgi:hypothetical protein